jgi:NADH-quinone oxidoreductase subunit D
MEELIHHFILVTEGVDAPVGEVYFGVENPKGRVSISAARAAVFRIA